MEHDDPLETLIRHRVEEIDVPPSDSAAVQARAHRIRVRNVGTVAAVTLVAGIGMVVPIRMLASLVQGSDAKFSLGRNSSQSLPDLAMIVCDGTGTHVLTPTVRPRADGTHFSVENDTGGDTRFAVDRGGDIVPSGRTEMVFLAPPGRVLVSCSDPSSGAGRQDDGPSITIEDQDGVWSSDAVQCPEGLGASTAYVDQAAGTQGRTGDLLEIARGDLTPYLKEGDVLLRGGYAEAAQPEVVLVRDGGVVLVAGYLGDESGGWLLSTVRSCGG